MSVVLRFMKTYWVLLVSGAVSIAAVTFAVMQTLSDEVVVEMKTHVAKATELSRLRSGAVNEECIEAERQHAEQFKREYDAALGFAVERNRRAPLLEGVFPEPGQRAARYRFKEAYEKKLYALPRGLNLPDGLNAGGLPTEREVRDEQEILNDIARRKAEADGEDLEVAGAEPRTGFGVGRAPGVGPGGGGDPRRYPGAGVGRAPRRGPATGAPTAPGPGGYGQPRGPGGMTPTLQPPDDESSRLAVTDEARYRAAVRKAKNISIYATLDPTMTTPSFDISPIVATDQPPTPAEMWYAQMSMWLQQDVVEAVREVNNEVARQLPEEESHVANMPVKRIVSVDVDGYVTGPSTVVPFPSLASKQVEVPVESFTGRVSNEQFDVIRLSLRAIVDQRDILKLVDAMTRTNFYQLIGLRYTLVPPDDVRNDGFFYGSEPVVEVTLTFEGYFARTVFKEMMPRQVLVDLGIVEPATKSP